jgi:hypothetical protein
MDFKSLVTIIIFFCSVHCTVAQQRQLVVLKNETVLARYQVGDVLYFARLGEKNIQMQKILDLNDTLIMMNLDSVAYYRIGKLDIRGRKSSTFGQRLGGYMIGAGLLLPIAELVNTGLVQKEGASIAPGIGLASGVLVAGGAALVFIKKPYFKPGRRNHIRIVDRKSHFFKGELPVKGYISPYIPRN